MNAKERFNNTEILPLLRITLADMEDLNNSTGPVTNGDAVKVFAALTKELMPYMELMQGSPTTPGPLSSTDLIATLTSDQKAALTKMQAWWAAPYSAESAHFVLRGYAGTGKTFLMTAFSVWVSEQRTPQGTVPPYNFIHWAAPTHKAAGVLSAAVDTDASTLHSLLCIKAKKDEERTIFVKDPYAKSRIEYQSLIVVDESSMVGEQLVGFAEDAAIEYKCKMLWVGDPAQLPPVGEDDSPAFNMATESTHRHLLKEVVRYSNDILVLATELRQAIRDDPDGWRLRRTAFGDKNGLVFERLTRGFEQRLFNMIDSAGAELFTDHRVIAWRNITVNRYNALIRERLGFTAPYCVNELLLTGDNFSIPSPDPDTPPLLIQPDREFRPTAISENVVEVKVGLESYDIPVWELRIEEPFCMTAVVAKSQGDVAEVTTALSQRAKSLAAREKNMSASERAKAAVPGVSKSGRPISKMPSQLAWDDFWRCADRFQTVRYPYAITAHRAQGSTYRRVFLNMTDILANSNSDTALRCLYVGLTRATDEVIVV